jgi:SAM-dependent methyltransferase
MNGYDSAASSLSSELTDTAAIRPETHARHQLEGGPPYSLDSALHVSRYTWAIEHFVHPGDTAVDFGCGTGFGVAFLAEAGANAVGIDLDPGVLQLKEAIGLENATFFCDNACAPDLVDRIGVRDADVVLSMETIEHLVDYFTYIENAIRMMKPGGVFVVGTPNRTLTYERYPERRHMDPSHVQEFTTLSLGRVLESYFESVELYFQYIPGFWSGLINARSLNLTDVSFVKIEDQPTLTHDAFANVAVCRLPKR